MKKFNRLTTSLLKRKRHVTCG